MPIYDYFLITLVAGLIATVGITIYMKVIARNSKSNVDMVRAVGGLYSRSYERAQSVGLSVHFMAGLIFSGVYTFALLYMIKPDAMLAAIIGGAVLAFIHGFIFSFVMVIIAKKHPLEKFRETSLKSVAVHFGGHLVYGVILGAVVGAFVV